MRSEQEIRKEYGRYLKVREGSGDNLFDKGYIEGLLYALGGVA